MDFNDLKSEELTPVPEELYTPMNQNISRYQLDDQSPCRF